MKSINSHLSHHHWSISVYLLLAILPGLTQMNSEFSLLVGSLVVIPILGKPWIAAKHKLKTTVVITSIITWVVSVHLVQGEWLSGHTFLSGLYLVIALKWMESQSLNESRLIVTGTLVLFALSSLSFAGFTALAYLILSVCCYVYLSLLINRPAQSRVSRLIAQCAKILALSFPVMTVLFVSVPRIQGPLWDLGIVMGLPIELMIDQDQREKGLTSSLQAGQVSRLKKSDEPILVAEFAGTVPYKSRLYWRGPVYETYSGTEWKIQPDWDNRSRLLRQALRKKKDLDQVITSKSDLVSYEARITANGQRWMYGLDFPYGSSPETFISNEFQVLGIRKLTQEFNYEQRAYLEYSGGRPLTQAERSTYLQLPEDSNARLIAWGKAVEAENLTTQSRIHQLRVHLAEGGYQITQLPDIDVYKDNLDEFFFDRKDGGIEHLASSAAIALRAAGVPTRLVSGYRGGSLIALTNFVVVRQAHAHVWVEAWDDQTGWQRVEAQDFVSPPKREARVQPSSASKKTQTKPNQSKAPATTEDQKPAVSTKTPAQPKNKPGSESGLKWLQTLTSGLETWVLNYNPDRQIELMKKSGLRVVDWKSLLGITLIGLLVLGILYGLMLSLTRRKRNKVEYFFERLNKKLEKNQLHCLPNECPSQWLVRIKEPAAQMYPAIAAVINEYIALRYSPDSQIKDDKANETRFINSSKRLLGMLS